MRYFWEEKEKNFPAAVMIAGDFPQQSEIFAALIRPMQPEIRNTSPSYSFYSSTAFLLLLFLALLFLFHLNLLLLLLLLLHKNPSSLHLANSQPSPRTAAWINRKEPCGGDGDGPPAAADLPAWSHVKCMNKRRGSGG